MPVLFFSPAAARLAAFMVTAALALPAAAQAPKKDEFQTSAPYAILIEADSGTVLFEKNADKLNPPASMSKLMTTSWCCTPSSRASSSGTTR
jgi:D-alanyl-D-alanine carboxypeptidase (penicillin-binding protein 5/6)